MGRCTGWRRGSLRVFCFLPGSDTDIGFNGRVHTNNLDRIKTLRSPGSEEGCPGTWGQSNG